MRGAVGLLLLAWPLAIDAVAAFSRVRASSGDASLGRYDFSHKGAWANLKNAGWLSVQAAKPRFMGDTTNQTVIVTHAGKNHQEYIDMAIMLGLALKRYVPDVPRVAMVIAGMTPDHQTLLRQAGWKVLKVKDEDVDLCEGNTKCDKHFQQRWRESFGKLNIFRLPFKRVLFLDADTYVFSHEINFLLNSTVVNESQIAMAPDGCKRNLRTNDTEYNSGVMFFEPSLSKFQAVVDLASTRTGDEMLDQNLINEVFEGKVAELHKKFDCVDPIGVPPGLKRPCKMHSICDKHEVVISHFTGLFKPTKANPHYLRHVQQAEGIKEICENTNHGGCQKWSAYYCAMHSNRKHLTKELQETIAVVGGCCVGHGHNKAECRYRTIFNNQTDTCPPVVEFTHRDPAQPWMSSFTLTNRTPTAFNEYRPIYASGSGWYMFYVSEKRNWAVGPDPEQDAAHSYAHADALCPQDANHWKSLNGRMLWQSKTSLKVWAPTSSCPETLRVTTAGFRLSEGSNTTSAWTGIFSMRSDLTSSMHGGKPVYARAAPEPGAGPEGSASPMYMYFLAAKTQWVIGPDWAEYGQGVAFVKGDAFCPKESTEWQVRSSWESGQRVAAQLLIQEQGRRGAYNIGRRARGAHARTLS